MKPTLHIAVVVLLLCTFNGCGPSPDVTTLPKSPSEEQAVRVSQSVVEGQGTATSTLDERETASPASVATEEPLPIDRFRPPDTRARHDVNAFATLGIHRYASQRLILYTDIDPAKAEVLPPLIDAVFAEWENYFNTLPPARDGSKFQITAYLIGDVNRYSKAGLLPADLPVFAHGKHQGQEFWMHDQEHAYYRRHLLIHEATHCFMQAMGGTTIDVPLWYLEGMAELFATHRLEDDGTASFRVIPESPELYVGLSRIEMIRKDLDDGNGLTLARLANLSVAQFQQRQSSYAWSWATCLLMDKHPRYGEPFRQLGRRYPIEGFVHMREELLAPNSSDFAVEWTLMMRDLCYGYDIPANAMKFLIANALSSDNDAVEVTVVAEQGWQPTGVTLSTDRKYIFSSSGQVTLANEPKPWVSHPDGITIRYAHGEPIGRLMGLIITETENDERQVSEPFAINPQSPLKPPIEGHLYLRVNDFSSERSDNKGSYTVTIGIDEG